MDLELSDQCPYCGNPNLIELNGEYLEIPSGDRDVPPDYKPIWIQEYCSLCGYSETKHVYEPDPDEKYDRRHE